MTIVVADRDETSRVGFCTVDSLTPNQEFALTFVPLQRFQQLFSGERSESHVSALLSGRAAEALARGGIQLPQGASGDDLMALLHPTEFGISLRDIEDACDPESQQRLVKRWIAQLVVAIATLSRQDVGWQSKLGEWMSVAGFSFAEFLCRAMQSGVPNEAEQWAMEIRTLSNAGKPTPSPNGESKRSSVTPSLVDAIRAVFSGSGPLAVAFSGYEKRWAQLEYAESVGIALENQSLLLAEAGTGVGKSLGYLVPSLIWATETGGKVVVSTHTKSLQDQLFYKDFPIAVRAVKDVTGRPELKTSLLRGRSNYLCKNQWEARKNEFIDDPKQAALMAKVGVWSVMTETGDLSELQLTSDERYRIRFLTALEENCPSDRCRAMQGNRCFLLKARNRARTSNLLLVNHALLLTELIGDGYVMAESGGLIVDEAHHLERVATDQLGFQLTGSTLDSVIHELVELRDASIVGIAPMAIRTLTAVGQREKQTEALTRLREMVVQSQAITQYVQRLSETLRGVAAKRSDGRDGEIRARIDPALRSLPEWTEVEIAWEVIETALQPLQDFAIWTLASLRAVAQSIETDDAFAHQIAQLESWIERTSEMVAETNALVFHHDTNRISWIAVSAKRARVSLNSAPLNVGEHLTDIFNLNERAVVLTSATLTAAGSFALLRQQMALEAGTELLLPSPFDHRQSTLLVLPENGPDPSSGHYGAYVAEAIYDVAVALGGRTLALFTSVAALRSAAEAIRVSLQLSGIELLAQDIDGPAPLLAERLRRAERVVVLGVATFWEGVDIRGHGLSALLIAKLPFDVPTDPVFAARSELYDNPFMDYSLPRAILRFRQGFGRLIRSQQDRGVVAVLDNRIVTRRYGNAFLAGLPATELSYANPDEFGWLAAKWISDRDKMDAHSLR